MKGARTPRARRAIGSLVLVATTLVAIQSISSAQAETPRLWGYNVHLSHSGADAEAEFLLAKSGGANSVRLEAHWAWVERTRGIFDWTVLDYRIGAAATTGVSPLLLIGTSPSWAQGGPAVDTGDADIHWRPPLDPADYGTYVAQVVARYGPDGTFWETFAGTPVPIAGIEVWNEPNQALWWRSEAPNPARYAALVNAADQNAGSIPVIAGAFAPAGKPGDPGCGHGPYPDVNQIDFLEEMYAAGVSFDAISVHPYNWGSKTVPKSVFDYHPCSAWSQMATATPEHPKTLRSVMESNGDGEKKIWITEAGAPNHVNGATYTCHDPGVAGSCMTQAQIANLAKQTVARWKAYQAEGWAGNFYWFQLRDSNTQDLHSAESHFGVVRSGGAPKPAHASLAAAMNATPVDKLPHLGNARVTGTTTSTIRWAWPSVAGASSYQVQTFKRSAPTAQNRTVSGTSATVTFAHEGTTWFARVRGIDAAGNPASAWSRAAPGSPDGKAPATGMRVASSTSTSLTWEWDPVAGAAKYQVISWAPGKHQESLIRAATETSREWNYPSGTKHFAAVRALDSTGAVISGWSSVAGGTTQ